MQDRTIHNPLSGERATWIETSRESGGTRTVADFEVIPGGGVPKHRHSDHEELIEVLEGEIEVTLGAVKQTFRAGERVVIGPRAVHSWRNPSPDRNLKFRGRMTPGHPGFEMFLRVWFGLGRDGELRPSGMPRRLDDLSLLVEWDPSIAAGPLRVFVPLLQWWARRAPARARAAELIRRYGEADLAARDQRTVKAYTAEFPAT